MSVLAESVRPDRRLPRWNRAELRAGFLTDAPMIGLIGLYVLCVLATTQESLADLLLRLPGGFVIFMAMTLVTAIALGALHCLCVTRPASPIRHMGAQAWQALKAGWLERWVPMAIAASLLMIVFADTKTDIPLLAGGFRWDETFHRLDVALHGGVAPWELLQPVLGYPLVTFVLNLNYSIWFTLMWGMFFFHQSLRGGTPGRTRFLATFVLLWTVGGTLLATIFSSAGPCYYGLVVGGADPYQPLMSYLRQADTQFPLMALDLQDMLWSLHSAGTEGFGISAMPSLHNAMALLMVLASWKLHPLARAVFGVHAILVFLGSIHLGWHYAVDAYASFALTLAIWFGLGPLFDRWDRLVAERRDRSIRSTGQPAAVSSARP
ncbi:phosphatase PAP2 family protein [Aureimonas sp. SK2]|uniref:phosphatase PAP2 family protein n=1 Tax=Aureimonas sp. SK2 TaxID=3015992 RepID=UPI0024445E95|nr:phosphatase PAP2 family protein [Aureimonas sp. SK2]